jgi:hypothetical protein
LEKNFHNKKRQRSRYNQPSDNKANNNNNDETADKEPTDVESGDLDGNDGNADAGRQDNTASKKKSKKQRSSNQKKKKKQDSTKGKNVLRRRRFHNFTPTVMAHAFLAYRRLDRVYHRATVCFTEPTISADGRSIAVSMIPDNVTSTNATVNAVRRPFLSLAMTGDLFLTGEAFRVIGLFVALARGVIDPDFVDCVFDEHYPHLVPTPPAPSFGMYAEGTFYTSWEGKVKAILSPRKCNRYTNGWNDDETLDTIQDWRKTVRERTAAMWLQSGTDQDGRLLAEKKWTEQVLDPWAVRAREQLEDYRRWKIASKAIENGTKGKVTNLTMQGDAALLPPLLSPPVASIDATVPELFAVVLDCLRKADTSGLWPTTTPKRQLVMLSTPTENAANDSENPSSGSLVSSSVAHASCLSVAHAKAKSHKVPRSSAYAFTEGQGGASGSFSVGAMPGDNCIQPKGNALFPELMKAAFELEMALCPNREPSSTIAINRNAQFRPHTDSGAGAGQSTSLIVGLGTYAGGELVVEGEKKDIRYQGLEFNGWSQRHWTMPFDGERFSLVWFTPKGCEGVQGIDLCK